MFIPQYVSIYRTEEGNWASSYRKFRPDGTIYEEKMIN